MPSFLGNYPGGAKNRKEKLHRAIDSVLKQHYENWELLVIADGCIDTVKEMDVYNDKRIKTFLIEKQIGFGIQRNTGVKQSTGDVICYLDSDDLISPLHCGFIAEKIGDNDWIWFNHYELKNGKLTLKEININKVYGHGTCNVAHKNRVLWTSEKYGNDDMIFVNRLKSNSDKYSFVGNSYYVCCHQSHITGQGYES